MGLLMMKVSSKAEIKDRIEKLYALAQGGATEGEAKAAIAMAEKLTVKYGISGINKNRYKTGSKNSRSGNATKSTGHYKTYTWDEWSSSHRKKSDKTSKWDQEYRNRTFGYTGIYADVLRETEKAWLLNIYLEEDFYKGVYKTSVWYPKSMVKFRDGNRWIVNEGLVMDNIKRNMGWLQKHHPAFRDTSEIRLRVV